MKNYEYPGAIHIHSNYSDGTAPIDSIIKDAQKAGLRWIIITDHDTLIGKGKGYEGFHGDLCVLISAEISPAKGNHFLALDIDEVPSKDLNPEEFINAVNKLGGFGFIAHADEHDCRNNDYPCLRWDNWDLTNFQGLEIWNYLSDWVDTLTPENKIHKFLNADKTLQGPSSELLKWWDRLNIEQQRIYPGIFGIDVHAFDKKFIIFPVKVFSYLKSFKTLRNYIQIDDFLSNDFEVAKKQIYSAVKNGNNIMVNYSLGDPKGTVFTITKEDDHHKYIKATVGETLQISDEFVIDVEVPQPSLIKLIHNSEVIKEETTTHLKHKTNIPGVYRFEAHNDSLPWIMSNPVKVINVNA